MSIESKIYESPSLGRVSGWMPAESSLFGNLMPTLARFKIGADGQPLNKVVAQVWQAPDGEWNYNMLKSADEGLGQLTAVLVDEEDEGPAHLLRAMTECDAELERKFQLSSDVEDFRKEVEAALAAG